MAKQTIAESLSHAAALTGDPVQLFQIAKNSGCDAFRGARVDLKKFAAWKKQNPDVVKEAEGLPSKEVADIKLKESRRAEQDMRNAKLAGSLVLKSDYDRAIMGIAKTFWPRVKNFAERAVPAALDAILKNLGADDNLRTAAVQSMRTYGEKFVDEQEADFKRTAEEQKKQLTQ